MVTLSLTEKSQTILHRCCNTIYSHQKCTGFTFLLKTTLYLICWFKPSGSNVESHCNFDSGTFEDQWRWAFSHVFVDHLNNFSQEISIQVPFLTFIYFWDRERQSMNRGGAEREGDTECETGSRLWAVSTEPDTRLKLVKCKILTWAEVGRLTNWATQVPRHIWNFEIHR